MLSVLVKRIPWKFVTKYTYTHTHKHTYKMYPINWEKRMKCENIKREQLKKKQINWNKYTKHIYIQVKLRILLIFIESSLIQSTTMIVQKNILWYFNVHVISYSHFEFFARQRIRISVNWHFYFKVFSCADHFHCN